jgi:hypothetical protein
MTKLPVPVELTDAELDAVGAGVAVGLVAVDISDIANNSLNNNDITVGIPVNAAVAVLGAAGAVQHGRIFS